MDKSKPNIIGAKLRTCRTNCGLSQRQVADCLGVNRSTYTYYENGRSEPDINTLKLLAKIFNVSFISLLPNDDSETLNDSENIEINPIYSLSKEEQDLLISFRLLNSEEKADILAKITNMVK